MVKGVCGNCHTMHNSQNGLPIETRADAAFNPSHTVNYRVNNLLVNTCIGCHSSTNSQTIVDLGNGTRIPIIYNTVPPSQPLAGGNFYYVDSLGDEFGHNVRTIDSLLSEAPGGDTAFGVIPNNCGFGGCHASLAAIRTGAGPLSSAVQGNGCIGCHDPAHHTNDEQVILAGGAKYVDEAGGGYRFLNKAGANYFDIPPHSGQPAVSGIEDPNWEQNPSMLSHNEYQDSDKPFAPLTYGGSAQGMSDFCGGCHNSYHSWPEGGYPNGGDSNPWLRHPAGMAIPDTGEYATYVQYNPMVPVARSDDLALRALGGPSSEVTPGTDKVMCLSCHRAHASPYPDMLRWDYETCETGAGTNLECGCFTCHSQKG